MTILFKKKLHEDEMGLYIHTQRWVSIHETPCFHFCVEDEVERLLEVMRMHDETPMKTARRLKWLKRIDKKVSRFAFPTEGKALEHLKFLKRKQLGHMKRQTEFIKAFLDRDESEYDPRYPNRVPRTEGIVNEYLNFD